MSIAAILIKVTRENNVNVSNLFIVLSDIYTKGSAAEATTCCFSCQYDWLWIVANLAALGLASAADLSLQPVSMLCIARFIAHAYDGRAMARSYE